MLKADDIEALAAVQGTIIKARRLAAAEPDPRKRDILLRLADTIEQRAREIDLEN